MLARLGVWDWPDVVDYLGREDWWRRIEDVKAKRFRPRLLMTCQPW